jgi:glutamate-1-semialdehyde aminotransferase
VEFLNKESKIEEVKLTGTEETMTMVRLAQGTTIDSRKLPNLEIRGLRQKR